MVKFISYDGKYPNLCGGTLVLAINNYMVEFPQFCMRSGGCVWFDEEWNEQVDIGEWHVKLPEEYKEFAHLQDEIDACVNANVPWGCCGGCI